MVDWHSDRFVVLSTLVRKVDVDDWLVRKLFFLEAQIAKRGKDIVFPSLEIFLCSSIGIIGLLTRHDRSSSSSIKGISDNVKDSVVVLVVAVSESKSQISQVLQPGPVFVQPLDPIPEACGIITGITFAVSAYDKDGQVLLLNLSNAFGVIVGQICHQRVHVEASKALSSKRLSEAL
jgi:hypothetical protein